MRICVTSVERALAVIRWPGVRGRTSRLAAYGEWARAMRDDGAFAVDPCRPADILMVVGDAVTMPWEGRWTAAARASTSSARPNWSSAGMAGKPTVGDVTDAEPHLAWLREQNRFSRIGPTA